MELVELLKILKKLDPRRFKTVDQKNKRRVIRAIEIAKAIGKVPVMQTQNSPLKTKHPDILKIGVKVAKEELQTRIKKRLLVRIKSGMIKEVRNLYNQGLNWKRLDNFGLEYRYVSRYLRGFITKAEMIEKLNIEICKYAKRQMTWFRKDSTTHWVENGQEAKKLVNRFLIKKSRSNILIL